MKRLLCYGDSNTWGYDPVTHNRFPQNIRWTGLLQEKLKDAGVRVLEEGRNGRTTVFEDPSWEGLCGYAALLEILQAHKPLDAAILMLGTNDCKTCFHASAEQIADGAAQCIDLLLQYVSADNILLISPLHLGPDVWQSDHDPDFDKKSIATSRQLADAYRKVAVQKQVRFLDAAQYAAASSADDEHLDPAGHAVMADIILKTISDML